MLRCDPVLVVPGPITVSKNPVRSRPLALEGGREVVEVKPVMRRRCAGAKIEDALLES